MKLLPQCLILFSISTVIQAFARPKNLANNNLPDDPQAIADIMQNEIQNASGLSDQQYQNFQSGLSALNTIAQNFFTGQISDVERPTLLDTVVDGQELSPTSPFLFEGDIVLTPRQLGEAIASAQEVASFQGVDPVEEVIQESSENNLQEQAQQLFSEDPRPFRKLTINQRQRWTLPIKYTLKSGVDAAAVRRGIALWEQLTCLKFQELQSGTGNYIEFFRGNGCFSNVGMIGGRQTISIGNGCTLIGIVAHEIGHALGFWHEQSRPDRDSFIRINEQNIQDGTLGNFLPRTFRDTTTLGFPFDFGSVMHYGPTAFARTFGLITIATIDPNYQHTIGYRQGLSFYDAKFINKAYCDRQCVNSRTACQHNGYPNPKNCNTCICPEGFGGSLCEKAASTTTNCGTIDLNASPSWQKLSKSESGQCNYVITSAPGRKVLIELSSFNFFKSRTCDRNYVEIKYGADVANSGARVCQGGPFTVRSETNEAVVLFRGSFGNSFSLRYRQDPPDVVVTPSPPTAGPVTTTTPGPAVTTSTSFIGWSAWTPWSDCTSSCGGCGNQLRVRRCFSADADCPGSWRQDKSCNFNACSGSQSCCGSLQAVNGVCVKEVITGWTQWGEWSSCTASCGACGVRTRRRSCNGGSCTGAGLEAKRCAFKTCPGGVCCTSFTDMDGTCVFGSGPTTTVRPVTSTTPEPTTTTPEPTTTTPEPTTTTPEPTTTTPEPTTTTAEPVVLTTPAPGPLGWSAWSGWTDCLGKSCGACGQKFRVRNCEANSCSGDTYERRACALQACEGCGGQLVARIVCPDDSTKFCPLLVGAKANCPCCAPYRVGSDNHCYPVGPSEPKWYVHPRK